MSYYGAPPPGITGGSFYGASSPLGRRGGDWDAAPGLDGWALLAQGIVHPAEDEDLFRVTIVTAPAGLTLFTVSDIGRIEAQGPVGTYAGAYAGWQHNTALGEAPFTITISDAELAGGATLGDLAAAGVASGGQPSVASGGADLGDASATGGGTAGVPSTASGGATLDDADAAGLGTAGAPSILAGDLSLGEFGAGGASSGGAPSDASGNLQLGEFASGGTLNPPADAAGDAELGGVAVGGSLAEGVPSTATGDAGLGGVAASGLAGGGQPSSAFGDAALGEFTATGAGTGGTPSRLDADTTLTDVGAGGFVGGGVPSTLGGAVNLDGGFASGGAAPDTPSGTASGGATLDGVLAGGVLGQRRAYTGVLAAIETGGEQISFVGVVSRRVGIGGLLAALAQEFCDIRSQQGLFIAYPEVLACAIKATRFYAGWAILEDPSARLGVFSITGQTSVTPDEWSIIGPLFSLYVERESALVIESARVSGVDTIGRDSATVAVDIQQAEIDLPQKAYVEPVFSVGFPT